MATTSTNTFTCTFTRVELLAFQVHYVVKATTNSASFEDTVDKGILKNSFIEVIGVQALDANNDINAEIIMRIDWDRNKLHITSGKGNIELANKSTDNDKISIAIKEIVKFFNKKVKENNFKSKWYVQYKKGIDRKAANELLELSDANELKWAKGEPVHVLGEISELTDELSIDLSVVLPEDEKEQKVAKNRGKVKWFNESKGFGFIIDDKGGDLFVHYSQIVGSGFKTLCEGDIVEYEVQKHYKGERAINVIIIDRIK